MAMTRATARQIALFYLLMALPGVPSLTYLPSSFVIGGDAAATAQRITESILTYRLIVLGALLSMVFFLILAWSLYHLFEEVDRKQARLLVIFVLVSVAMGVIDVTLLLAPLALQGSASSLSAFTKAQLDALTLGIFKVRTVLLQVDETFWGLWLLPFGILVIRSGFMPKLIGAFLIVGCFAWLALSATSIVFVHVHIVEKIAFVLTAPGELSVLTWFIVKAVKRQPAEAVLAYAT